MQTIQEIKMKLESGKTTSEQLVNEVIEMHNKWLDKNAVASINPKALDIAKICDKERKKGQIRGPLHGIPILIKDNILYQDGTITSCNSYAFHDFYPPFSASITKMLEDAGAIIVGKANLSEFAYFMSDDHMPSGYGSMHGQVKHPFDEKIDPYGSSTGSAVAVKLGIVPGAIGTETNGSLMAPAYQTQIVSYKPTFGYISKHGIIPISPTQDTAGPMAQTVYDCAIMMDTIFKEDSKDIDTLGIDRSISFVNYLHKENHKGNVGLLKLSNHTYDEDSEIVYQKSKIRLENLGYKVKELVIEHPKLDNQTTLLIEFKHAINQFLLEVKGTTPHQNLSDIISFNKAHQERCLKYGQTILEGSNETDGDLHSQNYLNLRKNLLQEASVLENLLIEHDLIAIAAPIWMGFAPIYGNPSVCIPEGVFNGIPKSMVFVGKKYDDHRLLQLTHIYQSHK